MTKINTSLERTSNSTSVTLTDVKKDVDSLTVEMEKLNPADVYDIAKTYSKNDMVYYHNKTSNFMGTPDDLIGTFISNIDNNTTQPDDEEHYGMEPWNRFTYSYPYLYFEEGQTSGGTAYWTCLSNEHSSTSNFNLPTTYKGRGMWWYTIESSYNDTPYQIGDVVSYTSDVGDPNLMDTIKSYVCTTADNTSTPSELVGWTLLNIE